MASYKTLIFISANSVISVAFFAELTFFVGFYYKYITCQYLEWVMLEFIHAFLADAPTLKSLAKTFVLPGVFRMLRN